MIPYTLPAAFQNSKDLLRRYRKFLVAEIEDSKAGELRAYYTKEVGKIDECLKELVPIKMLAIQRVEQKCQVSWLSDRPNEYHVNQLDAGDAMAHLRLDKP